MHKQHSKRWLAASLTAAVLTGCSSMAQQAAPVESARPAQIAAGTGISKSAPAPVAEVAVASPYQSSGSLAAKPVQSGAGEKTHVVQPGENLYRISLNNGLKYKDVAAWNNLPDTNIKVGQVLRLTPPDSTGNTVPPTAAKTAETVTVVQQSSRNTAVVENGNPAATSSKNYPKALKLPYSEEAARSLAQQSEGSAGKKAVIGKNSSASAPIAQADKKDSSSPAALSENKNKIEEKSQTALGEDAVAWIWPTEGKVIRAYSDSNKGLDISGRTGQAVIAAGDGKVVYSGNGLRGYGKLIIIKHNKTFLSAYAHNSQLLVKEGQSVKKGQKIAEMGNTDADQVKLHFEIRRFGKPVDPMQYLDNKS
ncbi:peptidoglycan DD-metalloendopeptidase family protein [Aquitalea magnusonii]|uniref:Murein DD-endopeptidase MepM/ murein hydrolase activator NlpD n=1 Tax=Aquitalea magnusonii TaxID=332411 RepID=A0A318JLX8_9NEIS|nr:peptidoglycan DD-metalloendopeptidase family protein [Aquitalea magnusonii]PXX49437.1 murein DD-endopeptidase MepM/ murein hydrolase activator NlpD [Aquitalea magnusonii]